MVSPNAALGSLLSSVLRTQPLRLLDKYLLKTTCIRSCAKLGALGGPKDTTPQSWQMRKAVTGSAVTHHYHLIPTSPTVQGSGARPGEGRRA